MRGEHSIEQLTLGCLQRIATATEAMSKYHVRLLNDRDHYELRYREKVVEVEAIARSNRALRGVITKLKRARKEVGNG